MKFDPNRNAISRHAVRAGLIALARNSRTIEMSDWVQAASTRDRTLTPEDRQALQRVAVSDEVIRKMAADQAIARAAPAKSAQGLAKRLARLRGSHGSESPPVP